MNNFSTFVYKVTENQIKPNQTNLTSSENQTE